MKSKPPLLLHLLAVLFLLASLVCLFGVIQTISSWNWLIAAAYQPHPAYNVFENSFLFLAFLGAAFLLWLRWHWAPAYCQATILLATAWFWVDRTLLAQTRTPLARQLFPLLVTIFILAFLLFSLLLLKPYMKAPFASSLPSHESGENAHENTPS